MSADEAKRRMKPRKRNLPYKPSDMLRSGSTLLDLACSGRLEGAFIKGHYYFFVGDSSSGKTFLSLTVFAEASINKHFKHYRFIYDGAEGGALMDIGKFFGKAVAERMEPPAINDDGSPSYSTTIEEFYYNVDDALDVAIEQNRPCIYVEDSMDVLSSEDESKKFDEGKEAFRKGKQTAGSWGDGKAKKNSANLRKIIPKLQQSGSILIIINQTRDNLGFGFEKKTRSGGHALKFYSTLEIWSSVASKIKRKVKGTDRQVGVRALLKVKKNRIEGRDREVKVPIYYSVGIDDIGSCVDFLVDEGHWNKTKQGRITPVEFEFSGTHEQVVSFIESNSLESELREVVKEVWDEIEAACAVKRKNRYE